jgi:phosphatidylglycerophosphate synthase
MMHERRPVPGRSWSISQRVVDMLIALHISPNVASLIGMGFGILAGCMLALTRSRPGPLFWILGALLIFLRSAMNIFDGMIAHRTGWITPRGGFVNDFTDRIADVAMLMGFGYARYASPYLAAWATMAALLTATVRTTGKAVGAPMYYQGLMSKPVRMYTLIVAALWMALSPRPWLPNLTLWIVTLGSALTVVHRGIRILQALPGQPEETP